MSHHGPTPSSSNYESSFPVMYCRPNIDQEPKFETFPDSSLFIDEMKMKLFYQHWFEKSWFRNEEKGHKS
jgi:hypothetical protein